MVPLLRIVSKDRCGEGEIPFSPGPSILEILRTGNPRIPAACGGLGICGLCRVRILEGMAPDLTPQETGRLSADQVRQGIRLACQIRPQGDLRIDLPDLPWEYRWQELGPADLPPPEIAADPPAPIPRGTRKPLGVAVDLGTTHLRLSLWDLERGARLAAVSGRNPQAAFGTDVLTRLETATRSTDQSRKISDTVLAAIGAGIRELTRASSRDPRQVGRLVLVGNTAMLSLLAGKNANQLLHPEDWGHSIDCRPDDPAPWCSTWGIAETATVELVPPLAGFVGSDLVAGILATGLTSGSGVNLLVDFGTNAEMALWDGHTLWATSAAGGPAFGEWGGTCGMPAETGAVFRVSLEEPVVQGNPGGEGEGPLPRFRIEVVGGGEARGLCGSGLITAISSLRRAGLLNPGGRLVAPLARRGFTLQERPRPLVLGARDLDLFQRAKASVAAGIQCLLAASGTGSEEVRRICVGGAFGQNLDLAAAREVGLLPGGSAHVDLCGNAALAGCELFLVASERATQASRWIAGARTLNLGEMPEFETRFIENLSLRPMTFP